MAVTIRCTHCNKLLKTGEHALGREVRCPDCQALFVARQEEADLESASPKPTSAGEPVLLELAPLPSIEGDYLGVRPGSRLPGYLLLTAAVPLLIPALALGVIAWSDGTVGVWPAVLWCVLGVVLAGGVIGLSLIRGLSVGARLGISLGIGGAALLAVLLYLIVAHILPTRSRVPEEAWQSYWNPAGRYQVLMPGRPQVIERVEQTPVGPVTLYGAMLEAREADLVFMVMFADYPPNFADPLVAEGVLRGMIGGFAQGAKGKLRSETDVRVGGHQAIEAIIDVSGPKKGLVVGRFFMVRNRAYMVTVLGARIRPNSADVRKFFESFELTREGAAPGPQRRRPPFAAPAAPPRLPLSARETPLDARPFEAAGAPQPEVHAKPLAGAVRREAGVTVTPINLQNNQNTPPSAGHVAGMLWADEHGSAVFILTRAGKLRKLSVPGFQVLAAIDLQKKCSGLARYRDGLLVALPELQEVWHIDGDRLSPLRKMSAPGVDRVTAAPESAVAIAGRWEAGGQEQGLFLLDFARDRKVEYRPGSGAALGLSNPVATPDGRYLFTRSAAIHRFRIEPTGLVLDGATPAIADAGGALGAGLQVSPDSRWVCFPCGAGNRGQHPNHPEIRGYGTFVYSVDDLTRPAFVVEQGAYPAAVAFDPAAKLVYSQNVDYPLIVFSAAGVKQKEYKIRKPEPPGAGSPEYLVHPFGRKLFLAIEGEVLWVELTP